MDQVIGRGSDAAAATAACSHEGKQQTRQTHYSSLSSVDRDLVVRQPRDIAVPTRCYSAANLQKRTAVRIGPQ